jgi:hypothetical protein
MACPWSQALSWGRTGAHARRAGRGLRLTAGVHRGRASGQARDGPRVSLPQGLGKSNDRHGFTRPGFCKNHPGRRPPRGSRRPNFCKKFPDRQGRPTPHDRRCKNFPTATSEGSGHRPRVADLIRSDSNLCDRKIGPSRHCLRAPHLDIITVFTHQVPNAAEGPGSPSVLERGNDL